MQYLLTLESKYLELGNIFFFEFLSLYKMHIQSCLQKIGISLSHFIPHGVKPIFQQKKSSKKWWFF